jgi:hypothetical protein
MFQTAMDEQLLEIDLRGLMAQPLLGGRCQLQFEAKLSLLAPDGFRERPSMIELWASIMVGREDQSTSPRQLGRAVLSEPVPFVPSDATQMRRPTDNPWVRSIDRLVADLDYRQLDEIEGMRHGGALVFSCSLGGLVHHEGQVARLYPENHRLMYRVSENDWTRLLGQAGYRRYLTVEVPLPKVGESTGDLGIAAQGA